MINNNDNCSTPPQNLVYESESCFYSQGRDIKNASITNATTGVSMYHGKVNDYLLFRPIYNSDGSLSVTLDTINKLIDILVKISATPGNTITLNPDGLYSAGGGAATSNGFTDDFMLMGG